MRALAAATGTPLIDLTALSFELWDAVGPEATKDYFLWLDAGESPKFPDGVSDNTHFQARGAIEVARLVVSGLKPSSSSSSPRCSSGAMTLGSGATRAGPSSRS